MMDDEGPASAPFDGEVVTTARTPSDRLPVSSGNPFEKAMDERTHAGAVAVESQRAIAEVQGRMVVAKRFPRDPVMAYARAMEACGRKGMADQALYSFNRGGKVQGASIRLAEELARLWGNIEYGVNELSRVKGTTTLAGSSEMEAFAWDLETNTRSSQKFTVAHIRDKTDGGSILTAERDIYELTANMGSRRVRARILAILPPELVDDAEAKCRDTVRLGAQRSLPDALREITVQFQAKGVNATMLQAYLGHSIVDATADEYVALRGVYQAMTDGAKASEFFGDKANGNGGSRLDKLEQATATSKAASSSDKKTPETKPAETKPPAQQQTSLGEGAQCQAAADPNKAVRDIVVALQGAATSEDLEQAINDPETVADRAWLAEHKPDLAKQVTTALDRAAARVAKG